MLDTGKRYYIVDTSGNYYKVDEKNSLVIARNSSEATLFTIREANARMKHRSWTPLIRRLCSTA